MTAILQVIFLVFFAYCLGALNSAILVCKIFRLPDPRTQGSGNPGATNILRLNGKKFALIVLTGDFLKGFIPVLTAKYFVSAEWLGWVGLAAIIGHIYPVFFQFKGGKGVATSLGVMLGLSFLLGMSVIFTWIIIAAIFRYSSLAAIIAFLAAPVYGYIFAKPDLSMLVLTGFIILYKHYANIKKLIAGTESKIGKLSS